MCVGGGGVLHHRVTQSGNCHFLAYITTWWKNSLGGGGGGLHEHLLSLYILSHSRTKLWCTLQLRGQVHSPNFYSALIQYVLCAAQSLYPRWFQYQTTTLNWSPSFSMANTVFPIPIWKASILMLREGRGGGMKEYLCKVVPSRLYKWISALHQETYVY